ncbi:MAG TPA: glycosyl hydrolase family 18 protein, partial [Acidimicrobiales bacterium]
MKGLALGLLGGLTILGAAPVAAALPAAMTRVIAGDPAIGPHARQDALHRSDVLHLQPSTAAIPPRQPRPRAAAGGATPNALQSSGGDLTREVFGFAPYWGLNNNAQVNWKYNLLSTVAYFGLTFNPDGSWKTNLADGKPEPGYTAWNSTAFTDMATRAHAAGDRVVLVVKAFDNGTICGIVYGYGQTAITNTIQAIQSKNIDGVNIDFEGSNTTCSGHASLQSGLTAFVSNLSTQVHQAVAGSSVTLDTYSGAASWDDGEFKIGDLASTSLDAMFVMAYDMNFSNMIDANNQDHAGPTAPLTAGPSNWPYNDTTAVQQYLSKAPASKVILGVPYYGYKWSTTSAAPYALTSAGGQADPYANVLGDLSCGAQQLQQSWDSAASSPWASWWSPASGDPCGGNYGSYRELYYDNAPSLGLKYDLVNNNNLRGMGMWTLDYQGTSTDLWNEISLKFVSPWEPLGGGLASGPAAVSVGTGRLDAFVQGTDNRLYHRAFSSSAWGPWEGLGGMLNAEPAAVSSGGGHIDLFVRGTDNAIYHRTFDGTTWGNWEGLGGGFSTGPTAASWSPGHLDVFALGLDRAVWHKAFDGTTWGQWESLGGGANAGPAAVSWGPNHIDL